MVRIAAVGDVHYDRHSRNRMSHSFQALEGSADILVLAGDLTHSGNPDEAAALAHDLSACPVPVVAVLGNHDFHQNEQEEIASILRMAGVIILQGNAAEFQFGGRSVGIVGLKGFGGGFYGACVTDFGEPEIKIFARHSRMQAKMLRDGLAELDTDYKIALTHFSPIEATLEGEKREIYPFLGSYLLAEAIDSAGAHAAFHGHAHLGKEHGMTPGGVPVRNVALTVIRHAYHIYTLRRPDERRVEMVR